MSYTCTDLAMDIENCADDTEVPQVSAAVLEMMGADPTDDDDGARILAERICMALNDRARLLGVLRMLARCIPNKDGSVTLGTFEACAILDAINQAGRQS